MRNFADLHIHTTASDGRWTHDGVATAAQDAGLSIAAITDHDTLTPAPVLARLQQTSGVRFVPGVEMTCLVDGVYVELVCYGTTPTASRIEALNQRLNHQQSKNSSDVLTNLADVDPRLNFSADEIHTICIQNTARQPLAIRDHLLKRIPKCDDPLGLMKSVGYKLQFHDMNAVLHAAHTDGWVCLIAHPGTLHDGAGLTVADLDDLCAGHPLDGLEAFNPNHTEGQTKAYVGYGLEKGLMVGGGSDSHHPTTPLWGWNVMDGRALFAALGVSS